MQTYYYLFNAMSSPFLLLFFSSISCDCFPRIPARRAELSKEKLELQAKKKAEKKVERKATKEAAREKRKEKVKKHVKKRYKTVAARKAKK